MAHDQLIATYIEQDPHRPGLDRARLNESGVHVWILIAGLHTLLGPEAKHAFAHGKYQGEFAKLRQLAQDFDISADEVLATLAYYERHQPLIDARITTNTATVA